MPNRDKCVLCGSKLRIRKDRPSPVVVYDDAIGTIPGSHYHKFCTNRACGCTQYYGYYTTGGPQSTSQVLFNPEWGSLPYFASSRETVFSMSALHRFESEILLGQMSFKQCADVYNHIHDHTQQPGQESSMKVLLLQRNQLDRRRLEDAYFQFSILRVCSWYPEQFQVEHLPLHGGTSKTLEATTSVYHGVFMEKYAKHRCEKSGCGDVVVIDGNMKNHRDVCLATHAGYTEYKGLPDAVRTGCPNTPSHKSRFCSLHKPAAPSQTTAPTPPSGVIIQKRVTRQGTLYEVAWLGKPVVDTTWESSSSLPDALIQEFETSQNSAVLESFSSGGQTVHTLSLQKRGDSCEPAAKRPRQDDSSSGFFVSTDTDLKCNTEKDRTRVNYRTAGILLGAWPCGTILMLGELFGAESKSQVYGFLHTFLKENAQSTADLRFICYDDGCHLKKYAANTKRVNQTPTATRLSSLNIVVDKMHFKGHIDPWCQENCNPYTFSELEKVDTEICEQIFSWMSKYARITQHMNRVHFLFFLLYLCDAHNRLCKRK